MQAIPKAAFERKCGDVVKGRVEASLPRPQLQLAHPGRIDNHSTARERDQLAISGGVAAPAVGVRYLLKPPAGLPQLVTPPLRFPHPPPTPDPHTAPPT